MKLIVLATDFIRASFLQSGQSLLISSISCRSASVLIRPPYGEARNHKRGVESLGKVVDLQAGRGGTCGWFLFAVRFLCGFNDLQ